jgi:outer membrane protein OmpA-like peptidoglycan-associated protein
MDALDANGKMYDFTDALAIFLVGAPGTPPVYDRTNKRKESLRILKNKFDGTYESDADREVNMVGILKNYQLLPTFNFGFGVGFHISKWVTLSLEQKFMATNNDVIDGYRWTQDDYPGFTRDYDMMSYTSIGFNFHVGRNKVEPLWWLNPNDYVYRRLAETNPDKIIADAFRDDDEDGVPNKLDKEPNTKKGCPVDVKGVSLDSDKDGIIDCEDKEPYSPPGYPVDQYGVAQIPPNPCCDEEDDLLMLGKDGVGPEGSKRKRRTGDCSKIELPGVYFDNDKYYIDPVYISSLHQIAERMQRCPDMRVVITGYDESRNDPKYNEQLAWNRAQKVADYLVEKYGISRDRFIVKYIGGKKSNAGASEIEKKKSRRVDIRYADEDEKGESNPPSPHPGYKAGSDK